MSFTPSVDPLALVLVEQSLMRGCAIRFESARAARPFDGVKHADVYSAISGVFDAHQAALLALIAKVGRVSNRLAPVNKLPLDVLVEILVNLPIEDCIQASHVCSHWRAAAINAPRVWTELELSISSRSSTMLFELLDRSKSAEVYLDLRLRGDVESILNTTGRLEPYFIRLRTLSCWADFSYPDRPQEELGNSDPVQIFIPPAPRLRSAILDSTAVIGMDAPCAFRFSETASAYTALERLHLGGAADGTFDYWPQMPALRHLHLHWRLELPISTLYRVLRCTPALQELIVEDLDDKMALPVHSDIKSSSHLSSLKSLSLYGVLKEHILRRMFADLVSDSVRSISLRSKYVFAYLFGWTTSWNFGPPQKLYGIISIADAETDPVQPGSLVDDITITRSLTVLNLDCYLWVRVPDGAEFPALESLALLGLLSNVEDPNVVGPPLNPHLRIRFIPHGPVNPEVHASVPALRTVRFFVGTRWRNAEAWGASDITSFMDRQIQGYSRPLEELFVGGGQLEGSESSTRAKLAPYAKRLVIDRKEIDEVEFDELLDWFPPRDWDVKARGDLSEYEF
ncbi:hypothetical protein EXIGLDRAFT_833092 [Exidia glandulosa HHB12029]|uniref:F-box domain-containing protein n=1 Tax=Exidia glandulosa HHB12029 TaxID=1314781 RepID=A0A165KYK8_EXIGL|nr:hypothetical protein EXIGLDRAFT_833092 [Exidia glandulosa HHB12029]